MAGVVLVDGFVCSAVDCGRRELVRCEARVVEGEGKRRGEKAKKEKHSQYSRRRSDFESLVRRPF